MVLKAVSVQEVLRKRIIATGLYDLAQSDELIRRIQNDEQAMLAMIGRLVVEEERGGSGLQQGIRALVNSSSVPAALETYNKLVAHELSDESFPLIPDPKDGNP